MLDYSCSCSSTLVLDDGLEKNRVAPPEAISGETTSSILDHENSMDAIVR